MQYVDHLWTFISGPVDALGSERDQKNDSELNQYHQQVSTLVRQITCLRDACYDLEQVRDAVRCCGGGACASDLCVVVCRTYTTLSHRT